MFVNVLLCETAKEDTVEAGVQPAQVDSTDVADAGLGLEHREENENQHQSSERTMQGEPGGPSKGHSMGRRGSRDFPPSLILLKDHSVHTFNGPQAPEGTSFI